MATKKTTPAKKPAAKAAPARKKLTLPKGAAKAHKATRRPFAAAPAPAQAAAPAATPVDADRSRMDAFGIAKVCSMLAEGEMLTAIAKAANVAKSTLSEWLAADAERSARARESRKLGAAFLEEAAQQAIQDAKNPFELTKARELAQHLRWKASKLNPRDFGDKLAVGGAEDLPPVQTDSVHTELPMAMRASRIASLLSKAQQLRDAAKQPQPAAPAAVAAPAPAAPPAPVAAAPGVPRFKKPTPVPAGGWKAR